MKTNNDFIYIKKWQFWDIYPKIVGPDAFPITNEDEWERYVERYSYRSHLIALVPNPKLDPWGREMCDWTIGNNKFSAKHGNQVKQGDNHSVQLPSMKIWNTTVAGQLVRLHGPIKSYFVIRQKAQIS